MQREPTIELSVVKAPNDDISLESHVCHLTRGQVDSARGTGKAADIVGVAREKRLLVGRDVFDNESAAKRIDDMLPVGVSYKATWNAT